MTKIAIIGSPQSGRTALTSRLGKKGDVSDITMYDFAKSGIILTAIDATGYPKSIKPLLTALNLTDIALLCIPPTGPDAYTGECIVALDLLSYKHGIIVLTKSDTSYPSALEELKSKIKSIISSGAKCYTANSCSPQHPSQYNQCRNGSILGKCWCKKNKCCQGTFFKRDR